MESGDIFGLVHDLITKLPAFTKVIQVMPFNASDIKRSLRVEAHIFIPRKADTVIQQCSKIHNILEREQSNCFPASSSLFHLSTPCTSITLLQGTLCPITIPTSTLYTCPWTLVHAIPTACDSVFPRFLTLLATHFNSPLKT